MVFSVRKSAKNKVRSVRDSDISAASERIAQKLNVMQILQEDLEQVQKIDSKLNQFSNDIAERHSQVLEQSGEREEIPQLTEKFKEYLDSFFPVTMDDDYLKTREKAGELHSENPNTLDQYCSSFMRLYEYLIPALIKEYGKRPNELSSVLLALIRVITLDSQLVSESYQKDKNYQLVETVSSVMENVLASDKVKTLLDTVDSSIAESMGVSAASEQLSSSVQEVADNAVNVAEKTDEVIDQTNKGQEVIENSLSGFLSMTDEFIQTKDRIGNLLQQISSVTQVVDFIKDVAEQTNLLALNASIEAARAGEQGRGFAVVAEEVRKLAEQTTNSVEQITATIEQVQEEAFQVGEMSQQLSEQLNERVDKTKNAITTLEKIVTQVESIGESTSNIAAIAEEQSSATQDITHRTNEALDHMENIRKSSDGMGETIYSVSLDVDQLRHTVIDSIPKLSDKQLVRVAKTEHLLWKWWLYNNVLGYHQMDKSQLVDHHQCRLGKWYDEMRDHPEVSALPGFQALENPHQQVHQLATQIYRHIQEGEQEQAESLFLSLEEASHQVITLLDQLFNQLDS